MAVRKVSSAPAAKAAVRGATIASCGGEFFEGPGDGEGVVEVGGLGGEVGLLLVEELGFEAEDCEVGGWLGFAGGGSIIFNFGIRVGLIFGRYDG